MANASPDPRADVRAETRVLGRVASDIERMKSIDPADREVFARELMRSSQPQFVRQALDSLASENPERYKGVFAEALGHADSAVRLRAVTLLTGLGPKAAETAPRLIERLKDENWMVRSAACRAIAAVGQSGSEDPYYLYGALHDLFEDSERGVRVTAARAMADLYPGNASVFALVQRLWARETADGLDDAGRARLLPAIEKAGRGANLRGHSLDGLDLSGLNLSEVDLRGASMRKTKLTNTNLSRADLRDVVGLELDSTYIREVRFSPFADDDWSVLRREYTGARFALYLLLLLAFLLPYVGKAIFWASIARVEEMPGARALIQGAAESHDVHGEAWQVISLVIGGREGRAIARRLVGEWGDLLWWVYPMVLLGVMGTFQFVRTRLTVKCSRLREEEDRSGFSPARGDYAALLKWHNRMRYFVWFAIAALAANTLDWLFLATVTLPVR